MVETYLVALLVVGVFFLSISIIQLKKQKIKQNTFVIWSIIGITLIVIALIPVSITIFQEFLGTQFSVSAVLGTGVLFLSIIVFYLHQRVDNTNERITRLTIELARNKFYKDFKIEKTSGKNIQESEED